MQSFRTELEQVNQSTKALVEKDIVELAQKIQEFREGKVTDEKFKSLRLARGVYGQRQKGVQMVRIKLPFGKLSTQQLIKIADISDEFSNGNLHLTTRQDIQIHHVSLNETPRLWAKLEQDDITIREACGNTVRNVTASAEAGILKSEPFDVSDYAQAVFAYFLRKPFGQELGRKIKISFSSDINDTALSYIHDIGFIPLLNGQGERGFKVMVAGGLGAQPFLAQTAFEFLEVNKIIPFIEAALRVFDRYGERVSRHKARLKYLVNKIGLAEFLKLVGEEETALLKKSVPIEVKENYTAPVFKSKLPDEFPFFDQNLYEKWYNSNVFEQRQNGYYGVYLKIQLGNISSKSARSLAKIASKYSDAQDLRVTINQGLLLKFVSKEELPFLFSELNTLELASPGFDSVADITACPGIDTCNLAISNSTSVAKELEKVINNEYPELIFNKALKIKISGCMNSCGQHSIAQIGFHGSSFKEGKDVIPALQLVLGGGTLGNGQGRIAEKVIKVASKRAPTLLRVLLNDFQLNSGSNETFNEYYLRQGKDYFYQKLKYLADNSNLTNEEYYDWGSDERYKTEIGVGECAGVVIDLVQTLFLEAEEKIELSKESISAGLISDAIYHAYAAFINGAKGLLLDAQQQVNTQHVLINDFDKTFINTGIIDLGKSFRELVLQINKNEPTKEFARRYLGEAENFLRKTKVYREFINIESKN